ncbi:MAG: hypothetical protein KUG77_01145, partial [Nannocystaceae bacterium]|nr:hypothetical protein [Nannocystaceae bacterium]
MKDMLASILLPLALLPAPSGAATDDVGPIVEITDPSVAVVAFSAPYSFTVTVEASDEGSGVEEVALRVGGELRGEPDTEPPYSFDISLEAGFWTLTAEARDYAGNLATSQDQAVLVIDEEEEDSSTGEDEGSTGNTDASTSTGGDEPESEGDEPGDGGDSSSGGGARFVAFGLGF